MSERINANNKTCETKNRARALAAGVTLSTLALIVGLGAVAVLPKKLLGQLE